MTIVFAWCWCILIVSEMIFFPFFHNFCWRTFRFSLTINWIVQTWGRIWVRLEFVFTLPSHFLWNIAKILMRIILTCIWRVFFCNFITWVFFYWCHSRIWFSETHIWIIISRRRIWVWIKFVFTLPSHFLWYISKILVRFILASIRILTGNLFWSFLCTLSIRCRFRSD